MTDSYIQYCTGNYDDVIRSDKAICVYCKTKFNKQDMPDWDFDYCLGDKSVICPNCDVDAVIGDATITWTDDDVDRWHNYGFSGRRNE